MLPVTYVFVSLYCPFWIASLTFSLTAKTNKKNTIDEGDIAPGLAGATKTNKKNTIDEGYIAPGLRGAKKKLTRKNTIDEGYIAPGLRGAKKKTLTRKKL
jgi:hypothetical protein